MNTKQMIVDECDSIRDLLLDKNRKYGDSALNPKRVFSKSSTDEQINVRMDDKLSRIAAAQGDDLEDAELDLLGYLILKRVHKRKVALDPFAGMSEKEYRREFSQQPAPQKVQDDE